MTPLPARRFNRTCIEVQMTVQTDISKATALELFRRGVRLIKARRGVPYPFVYLVRGQLYYTDIPHSEMMATIRSIESATSETAEGR